MFSFSAKARAGIRRLKRAGCEQIEFELRENFARIFLIGPEGKIYTARGENAEECVSGFVTFFCHKESCKKKCPEGI
jgi:hypothetical protein